MPVYARRERNDQLHTCTHEQTQQRNNDHAMLWSRQFDHSTCRAALARLSLAELSWASSRLVHEPRLLCRKRKGRNIAESTAVSMGPLRERSRFVAAHRARQNRPGTGGTGNRWHRNRRQMWHSNRWQRARLFGNDLFDDFTRALYRPIPAHDTISHENYHVGYDHTAGLDSDSRPSEVRIPHAVNPFRFLTSHRDQRSPGRRNVHAGIRRNCTAPVAAKAQSEPSTDGRT